MRIVYVTAPSAADAERLGRLMLERQLAACANILGPIRSIYRWKGAVESADEVAVLLKTRAALVDDLISALAAAHPYETPCAVALDISAGHAPFLDWIMQETIGANVSDAGREL